MILNCGQEVQQVRKIIERLADAHYHDMANSLSKPGLIQMLLDLHNLLDNFSARQVTALSQ
ncbi:hypothetical protein D3C87_2101310 [compost metagenome]